MLVIRIPDQEVFHEDDQTFSVIPGVVLHLEHSLVAVSKWESKWEKSFLSSKDKTDEQVRDYIVDMCIDDVSEDVFYGISSSQIDEITEYIQKPATATIFSKNDAPHGISREIITSEVIYYWMVALQIPFECQNWHINRLLTLIKICNIKNQPPKKQNPAEAAAMRQKLNAERRAKYHTRG